MGIPNATQTAATARGRQIVISVVKRRRGQVVVTLVLIAAMIASAADAASANSTVNPGDPGVDGPGNAVLELFVQPP